MRRLIIGILLIAVLVAGVAAWLLQDWQQFRQRPLTQDGPVNLWLDSGTSFRGMVRQLELLGVSRFDWRWRLLGRVESPVLKAGEYRIDPGMSVSQLLERIVTGQVRKHRFTIVEGWTVSELRSELTADSRLRKVAADLTEAELMQHLDCGGCEAEGRFLPETYFFVRGSSDLQLLERAYADMSRALEAAWSKRDDDLPLDDPYELLVLASLIERETGRPDERSRIAGVFVRRLRKGMRLQTDPTVVYGLGEDFAGRLRRVHLTTDHPWNTYTRHGLPPTPIALPGRASLEAAARPAEGTALYFVARGDGSHHFSNTLAEHNAAVDRYIRGR
ncbi:MULTISPECIES: endolytic transglycosylase MltG [unclassified Wenzhouxiangella]|uniref:endolytic transglycosylase MltG n=1 Tax=unclassified Wenzhouxiangella TaxID=2613841 RepID=UPI000E328A74|nr:MULTISPECIES: endolytic transglycosylase MltG [unclassified Wenzhouxiangella]RFF27944.1 endolytic transglycosylase MltG [Wenzhouxiangella sp. 15181]RFP68531.1 endolytic transglycosylase MltG [Wenzhouxiangella sp. 15190]